MDFEWAMDMWFDSHNYLTKKDYLAIKTLVKKAKTADKRNK